MEKPRQVSLRLRAAIEHFVTPSAIISTNHRSTLCRSRGGNGTAALAAAAIALLAAAALPLHVDAAPPNQLRFKEDGTFKLLMLTDLHYGDVNSTLDQLTDGVSALLPHVAAGQA